MLNLISERYGHSFEDIGELTYIQFRSKLDHMNKRPAQPVILVEPPKH